MSLPLNFQRFAAFGTCLALVGWFWVRGEQFIASNGPTFDEGVHLAAGHAYWSTGNFRLNAEDPPLMKLMWALPLQFTGAPQLPGDAVSAGNHWHVANTFLYESGVPPRQLLDPARRVNLAIGCCLVILVGWVASRVWGSLPAGVAGCAFAASDPTLLALSCVLSTDIGMSLTGLLTCYLMWEYAAAPSRFKLLLVGVSLGLMLSSKFSAVALVAGLGLAGAVHLIRGGILALPDKRNARGFRPALELAFRLGVIAVVALAATYFFIGFPEWGKGLKFQLTRGAHGDGVYFFHGEVSRRGWYHYFLVALALKLPLGLIAAAGIAAVSHVGRRALPIHAVFLIVPPVVFLALASYSRVNIGVRAVYPCVPFLYLLAAGIAAPGCCRLARGLVFAMSLGWCIVAAQRSSPQEISYFNELAGGPVEGGKYIADSNLDWGQGLPGLKNWMDSNGVDVVYLGYFGTDRPEAHGIRFQALPGYGRVGPAGGSAIPLNSARHILAVSANHRLGLFLNDPETYSWLQARTPVAVVGGGSIALFDLTDEPEGLARVRRLASQ